LKQCFSCQSAARALDAEFARLRARGVATSPTVLLLKLRERIGELAHFGDADGTLSDSELALDTQSFEI
jgi:hypothetical protein